MRGLIDFSSAYHNPAMWKCSPADEMRNHPDEICEHIHYGMAWPLDDPATWPWWVDALGVHIQPGDYIAVATISGRSPSMVVAQITRINRKNSRGELHIGDQHYLTPDGNPIPGINRWDSVNQAPVVRVPGATVTATPLRSRFGSWRTDDNSYDEKVRPSTYQFIRNIVWLDPKSVASHLTQQ